MIRRRQSTPGPEGLSRARPAAKVVPTIATAVAIGLVVSGFFYAESVAQRRAAEDQLYVATVARAADAIDHGHAADAARLLSEARGLTR
jgi:hypothetical protein